MPRMIEVRFDKIEDELRKATDWTGKTSDPPTQSYMEDLATTALQDMDEDKWGALSNDAKAWCNEAGLALNATRPIPEAIKYDPTKYEPEDEVEEEKPVKQAARPLQEEPDDDEEPESESDEEEDEEPFEDEGDEDEEAEEAEEEGETEEATATPVAVKQEERAKARKDMRTEETTAKTTRKAKAPPAPTKTTKPAKAAKARTKVAHNGQSNGQGKSSKTALVAALLKRKTGVTRAEILKATGWPSVSVQAIAKAAGLKVKKHRDKGQPTKYFGS